MRSPTPSDLFFLIIGLTGLWALFQGLRALVRPAYVEAVKANEADRCCGGYCSLTGGK